MNKIFNEEEIQILRDHPGIEFVSDRFIRFNSEFKKQAYDWYITGGSMVDFFRKNGIDPELIGLTRIYSFTNNLKNKKLKDNTFEDGRCFNSRRPRDLNDPERRIDELETKVIYLQQEVEFLKKNLRADMEARELWESKLQRMRSLKSSKEPSNKVETD